MIHIIPPGAQNDAFLVVFILLLSFETGLMQALLINGFEQINEYFK